MLPIGGLGNNTWTMDVSEALEAVEAHQAQAGYPMPLQHPVSVDQEYGASR
jgi:L-ascorbate metabolism protein UlaG (beta-lactamase superfamily)